MIHSGDKTDSAFFPRYSLRSGAIPYLFLLIQTKELIAKTATGKGYA